LNRSAPPPDSCYQAVRDRLLERGYLEGPIERFMLGDLLSRHSRLERLLRTALKAGAIGAAPLGALLAAAAAMANRPLLGTSDLFLLWVYFTPLAGAALFLLDLVAALIVTALVGKRAARAGDALRAALIVGLPTLLYLLLLWGQRRPEGGLPADLLFLALAVATTLLVATLARLVSLVDLVGRSGQVPARHRAALLLLGVLVPCSSLLIVARSVAAPIDQGADAAPFELAAGAPRLLFVGLDGMDRALIDDLAPLGSVPYLEAALWHGAAFDVRRTRSAEPPQVWTTILTGTTADRHGVKSAGSELLPGVDTPLSRGAGPLPLVSALRFLLPSETVPTIGSGRRVRTLPEIVGLRQPALAIGWWASWPADLEGRAGYVVSDRVLAKLLSDGEADRETAPPELFRRLQEDFEDERTRLRGEFAELFTQPMAGAVRRVVWESFVIDGFNWGVTQRLSEDEALRGIFVYLPGLDILRQRLGRESATRPVLATYVGWLDGLLARALDPAPGRVTLVVADPGRAGTPEGGFAVALGHGALPDCRGEELNELDLAPLALALLQFPASRELPGRRPEACLATSKSDPETISSYGRRGAPDADLSSSYDREMVERLRSLGYLN